MAEFIIPAIIAAAAGAVAAELLRPKPPTLNPVKDYSTSEASVRGTIAPLLLGYDRVVPVFGWVGNRKSWERKTGEIDGGWFHSDTDITQTEYRESGMHILGVGPMTQVAAIYEDGKNILTYPIHSSTYPSGSHLTAWGTGDEQTFQIFWGEEDQPVCEGLAAQTGVQSSFPHCCYIYWKRKELGRSPRWKQVEYVLECPTLGEASSYVVEGQEEDTISLTVALSTFTSWHCFKSVDPMPFEVKRGDILEISSPAFVASVFWKRLVPGRWSDWEEGDPPPVWIDAFWELYPNKDASHLVPGPYTVNVRKFGTGGRGVNPARAIRQLLFKNFPHGLGFSQSLFDTASLDALIPDLDEEGVEATPSTLLLRSGKTYKDALSMYMQDFGILVYPHADTGLLTFKKIRSGVDTSVVLGLDTVDATKSKNIKAYSVLSPQKLVYSFIEASRLFKSSTLIVGDDGTARLSDQPNTKKIQLNTPTDIQTASKIASRKEQEARMDQVLSVEVSLDTGPLNVGQLVEVEGVAGTWRVGSAEPDTEKAGRKYDLVMDAYTIDNNYVVGDSTGVAIPLAAVGDLVVLVLEGNRYLNPDQNGYYFMRVRGAEHMEGATLYKSPDDTTYNVVKGLSYDVGGHLNESLSDTGGGVVESLEITAGGSDFASFWNITQTEADWRSGKVMALIGQELVYVESITIVNETTVTLNNVLRAREGTSKQDHAEDDGIIFFYRVGIPFVTDVNLVIGQTSYLKSVPYSAETTIPIGSVASQSLTYTGGGYRPLACENLTTLRDVDAWVMGDDLEMRWDYKNGSSPTGAGFPQTGEVSTIPAPEGSFIVEIYYYSSLYRTTETTDPYFTYTQVMMDEDDYDRPQYTVRVYNSLNGLTSPVAETTFIRV